MYGFLDEPVACRDEKALINHQGSNSINFFFFAYPVTAQSAPGSECGKQHNMTKRQKIQSTLTRIEPFNLIKI